MDLHLITIQLEHDQASTSFLCLARYILLTAFLIWLGWTILLFLSFEEICPDYKVIRSNRAELYAAGW